MKKDNKIKKFNPKRLLVIAYFWRYGILGVAFVLPIISGLLFFNIELLQPYTTYAIFFSIGIPLCAMGIDYILGCIFEFDHMILVSDSCYHKKMDPYDLVWNVSKKEFIGVGAIFICFGIAMFVVPFL